MPIEEVESTAEDIEEMEIRGAATIAAAAAEALGAQAAASDAPDPDAFEAEMRRAATELYETRPTAVSLPNALRFVLQGMEGKTVEAKRESIRSAGRRFRNDLETAQERLGRIGANRLRDGDVIMTHCHSTDALATVEHAVSDGKHIEAFVKETRPRNQGQITASQLRDMGVPVTMIVDSAAHRYLNDVDHVLVGADSIAADGSVINKIGTSGLAVNARDRGTPIVVAAQTLKLHPGTLTGHTVEIEMRAETEVISADDRADIGEITVENPAFDVTPPRHIDAIITERGQFPPESIVSLMRELYGDMDEEPWTDPE
ncbi:ribose 1,5-bisphosphate isomerase [Halodesulfurarchaeum sp.]|uniref:ribose 1,5-bisphosphate isomerase n=1 Tax=Halodesulfurarchaeum sp. TaxID=1980530 RepID=UPI002FC2920D